MPLSLKFYMDCSTTYLQEAISQGIIDASYVQNLVEMKKRERILMNHPYSVWCGSDGKWHTYLPDEEKGRVPKKRTTKEAIEDLILSYWEDYEEKNDLNRYSFKSCYDSFKEMKIACGISSNTVYKYDHDYKRFFSGTEFEKNDIRNVNEEQINIFMIQTIKRLNLKKKAADSLWGYISGTFHSARVNRKIKEDPCQYVNKQMFSKFYNREQANQNKRTVSNTDLEKILSRTLQDHIEKPLYMPSYAVELAIYTGMRSGELAGLKWQNVRYKDGVIVISESEKHDRTENQYRIASTKTYKQRQFPITKKINSFFIKLQRVQTENGITSEFVFTGIDGKIHPQTISDCARNKCIQCGVDTKSIQALRRTLNSRLKCSGVSTTVASSMLGHTEEVNENNYTYDTSEMDYKREMLEKISC